MGATWEHSLLLLIPIPKSSQHFGVGFHSCILHLPSDKRAEGGGVIGGGSLLPDEIRKRLMLSGMAGNQPNVISSEAKRVSDID